MTMLQYGSTGSQVRTWQHALNLENPDLRLPETGNFLDLTKKATIAFQSKYGLAADGIVGPMSIAKMREVVTGVVPSPTPPAPIDNPSGDSVLVLDIFGNNNVTSFDDAKRAGVEGIIHKISQGTSKRDSLVQARWPQIKRAGIIPGAYLFFEPSADADAQYELFKSIAAPLQADGDWPWALDYGEYDLTPRQANRDGALNILRRMEKDSGLIPMCYGATGLLNQYELSSDFARYAPWLANPGRSSPRPVTPWNGKWVLFQYAESTSGQIPGMGVGADINKFNGNLAAMKQFIASSRVGYKPPVSPDDGQPDTPIVVTLTPWMDWMERRKGWTEFDHNQELSKYWYLCGLDYTSVIGAKNAWCALTDNAALNDSGFKGTGSAAAASFEFYGTACDYVFGAILPIRHASGGHHVTCFVEWVDKARKIALCRGGNQANAINDAQFNLSGNANGHDQVMSGGPRWPVKKAA